MKKHFRNASILCFVAALAIVVLGVSLAHSTTLQWDEVTDTEDYTIAGYVIYFWAGEAPDKRYAYVTDDLFVTDIENTLNLIPGTTYTFTVAPYTTYNELGEESPPFEFTCEERPAPGTTLPTQIYIPGPIILTFDPQ
jgi:hypothetical protein